MMSDCQYCNGTGKIRLILNGKPQIVPCGKCQNMPMSDTPDYVPKGKPTVSRETDKRYPPRTAAPKTEMGQDFFTLTEKHGRPNGPFDKERKLPYRGA